MSQIEKQQFQNNTDGHIGVVIIGPRGDDRGIGVEPHGTDWLSEAEQRLTANAPRSPEFNPFVEWTMQRTNPETGAVEDYTVTPLTPTSEDRWVPADNRPIPGDINPVTAVAHATAAALADEPSTVTTLDAGAVRRHAEVEASGEDVKPNVPPAPPARAAAAAEAAQVAESTPAPAPEEETAAKVDSSVGEETGAALPPTAPAPQGEFAQHEEVGTPSAPQAQDSGSVAGEPGSDTEADTAPAPYSPPQE